jgi:hypothetical protein
MYGPGDPNTGPVRPCARHVLATNRVQGLVLDGFREMFLVFSAYPFCRGAIVLLVPKFGRALLPHQISTQPTSAATSYARGYGVANYGSFFFYIVIINRALQMAALFLMPKYTPSGLHYFSV